ncbi:MAG: four helix bundle protein [Chthoniobacterales bacterium]|nr:four helix bundle protein [Chthoniobacterales bacterium]
MSEKVLEARTKEYARRVIRLYSALPRSGAAQVLGHQLLRSGTSIGANYREAMRSRSKAEFIAKLGDSLKEASESAYWLELLSEESLVSPRRLQPLLEETGEITAILVSSIKTARRQ